MSPKGQGDSKIFQAQYLNNRVRYIVGSYWLPIRNRSLRVQWSRDRWRHVNPKGQGRESNIFQAYLKKPCETDGRFKLTTYRKPHIASPMVTWLMTSRDAKRSWLWVHNLSTSLLVSKISWLVFWTPLKTDRMHHNICGVKMTPTSRRRNKIGLTVEGLSLISIQCNSMHTTQATFTRSPITTVSSPIDNETCFFNYT